MRHVTRWVVGGLLTLALWGSGVGAHPFASRHRDVRHDGGAGRHDRQESWRDHGALHQARRQRWRARRAGNSAAVAAADAARRRARAALCADRRALRHDGREVWEDRPVTPPKEQSNGESKKADSPGFSGKIPDH